MYLRQYLIAHAEIINLKNRHGGLKAVQLLLFNRKLLHINKKMKMI